MGIKVLVVDDSALMRKMISDILNADSNIEVVDTAHNGKDALIKIEKHHPDVITMDVEMPIMNGIDAVREIMKTHGGSLTVDSKGENQGSTFTISVPI